MTQPTRAINSAAVNYLNIGLMLFSTAVAFFIPFELFLFSYAVLGPLHYLTEISWLEQRQYFTKGRWDFFWLALCAVLVFVFSLILPGSTLSPATQGQISNALIFAAFAAALAMAVLREPYHRFLALMVVLGGVIVSYKSLMLVSLFLPTLVHVYFFTGLFILSGALKGGVPSGYVSLLCFVACPLLFLLIRPETAIASQTIRDTYSGPFAMINFTLLQYFEPQSVAGGSEKAIQGVFGSAAGFAIMRMIAFAYTYHYLNWFAKTSVIQWHRISKTRMLVIGLLWLASVTCYVVDYTLGFKVLFCLSFVHVFLEFPLDHLTFLSICRELAKRVSPKRA